MKSKIRERVKKLRREMTEDEVKEKSFLSSKIFIESSFYKNSNCIMLYKRLGNETDTNEIIKQAFSDKKRLVFPVTDEKSGKITPYYADTGTEFKIGGFSINEPENAESANPKAIDVILIPGIAFDRAGNRIGFGKGCYDMFLPNTNAVKIGFCYSFQVLDKIPCDEHDIKLDFIITEKEIIDCRK